MIDLWTEEMTGKATVKGAGMRILVVDDNADCAESMAMLLRLYGHDVGTAPNGWTALEKAEADNPDVILLDIGLPGMDGYEVARQLCQDRPRKRPLVIAVTGYGQETDREHSVAVGIDRHMVKPVDPGELREVLEMFQRVLSK